MAPNYSVKLISDALDVGKSIFWDAAKDTVMFVDATNSDVYVFSPKSSKINKSKVGLETDLAFVFPIQNKKNFYIGCFKRSLITFTWNGTKNVVPTYTVLKRVDDDDEDLAGNKVCGANVDPQGVLWVGTMGPEAPDGTVLPYKGSIYSLKKDELKQHDGEFSKVTGFAWDAKINKMYFSDSVTTVISSFDWDPGAVQISNKSLIFDIKKNGLDGNPGGLAMDSQGFLWVAIIGNSCIIQLDPVNKKLIQTIEMPTTQVTGLAFGNKALDALYVTTSRVPINGVVPEHPAGCTCVIQNIGYHGVAPIGWIQ